MKFEDLSAAGRQFVNLSQFHTTPFPDKHITIQMLLFKQPGIKNSYNRNTNQLSSYALSVMF